MCQNIEAGRQVRKMKGGWKQINRIKNVHKEYQNVNKCQTANTFHEVIKKQLNVNVVLLYSHVIVSHMIMCNGLFMFLVYEMWQNKNKIRY